MARLSLTPHGAHIVFAWMSRAKPEDRELVAQVLEQVGDGLGACTYHYTIDKVDKNITVVQPRDGLCVLVRMWPVNVAEYPNHFDVLSITEIEQEENGDVG
ncbi:hypothetical protein [Nonomuraea sp. NPDC050786]|uniref:hypothetical protein n=1 Tax=Nonomuraea sp. NPDC050786 TaxID=3154840 RepID=UPI0033CEDC71